MDRTVKRVDGSAWLQTPLLKFSKEEEMMELTASRGAESMVAIDASVAGLITSMTSFAGDW